MFEYSEYVLDLQEKAISFVAVTLVDIKGSAPQEIGAKMLVTEQGIFWGTIGGGKIEAHSIKFAQSLLDSNDLSQKQKWNLQTDIGMSCGGEVEVFFDVNKNNNPDITIFGAGHVSQELCRVLTNSSFNITVLDTRPEWLEKIPTTYNIKKKLSSDLAAEVESLPKDSYLICMTMGHTTDLPVLYQACLKENNFKMIGVIGSDVKGSKIKKELMDLKIEEKSASKIVCPIGLDIGNNTPFEISISICSYLLALRDKKTVKIV